jgi:hypothetical protein
MRHRRLFAGEGQSECVAIDTFGASGRSGTSDSEAVSNDEEALPPAKTFKE